MRGIEDRRRELWQAARGWSQAAPGGGVIRQLFRWTGCGPLGSGDQPQSLTRIYLVSYQALTLVSSQVLGPRATPSVVGYGRYLVPGI